MGRATRSHDQLDLEPNPILWWIQKPSLNKPTSVIESSSTARQYEAGNGQDRAATSDGLGRQADRGVENHVGADGWVSPFFVETHLIPSFLARDEGWAFSGNVKGLAELGSVSLFGV